METGTPILDDEFCLRLGVSFIVIIDFKSRIRLLSLRRAILRSPDATGDTIRGEAMGFIPLTRNSEFRIDNRPNPSQVYCFLQNIPWDTGVNEKGIQKLTCGILSN